jgi:hypothetical protein
MSKLKQYALANVESLDQARETLKRIAKTYQGKQMSDRANYDLVRMQKAAMDLEKKILEFEMEYIRDPSNKDGQ